MRHNRLTGSCWPFPTRLCRAGSRNTNTPHPTGSDTTTPQPAGAPEACRLQQRKAGCGARRCRGLPLEFKSGAATPRIVRQGFCRPGVGNHNRHADGSPRAVPPPLVAEPPVSASTLHVRAHYWMRRLRLTTGARRSRTRPYGRDEVRIARGNWGGGKWFEGTGDRGRVVGAGSQSGSVRSRLEDCRE